MSFESGTPGKADLRSATELTDLLTGKQIPICILNACQSAKYVRGGGERGGREEGEGGKGKGERDGSSATQPPIDPATQPPDDRETSLGAALMAAGMQTVLAMGYSVTVSAAEILMTALYQQLFAGKPLDEAIRLGRKALFDRKERRAYFNQIIPLEDWLLPVVYGRGQVELGVRPLSPQEEEQYWQQQAQVYRFDLDAAPTYGFVGRDLEILKIERSLLRHNVLLVQGMGGTGKTTLLKYLREWWQTTHFVQDTFYFGYDEKAHTLEQILFAVGQRLYDRFEAAQFQAMALTAQVQKLAATLRATPHVLILDNLESVTGQPLAIQNTLNPEQQAQLRQFLQLLLGGQTKVVLGSRSREAWLDGIIQDARYELRGLDEEARTALADKILARQVQATPRIEQIRQSDDFKKLMKLLAGYPLAMEVVLGNLKRQSPAEVLAGLDAADVNLDTPSENRTQSILKCVEYSHSNLSPAAQQLLVCLAPFSGFLFRPVLSNYAAELQKLAPFQSYPFEQLDGAVQEAIDWGLLSPINPNFPQLLTLQPVFPYFLKTKLNQLDEATQQALTEGFKNHYRGLAGSYEQLMDSKEPQERQTGILFCQWEYENLYNALKICLEKQESINIYACLDAYLNNINDIQNCLQLSELVCKAVETYLPDSLTSDVEFEIAEAYLKLGNCYLKTQTYSSAKTTYLKLLGLLQGLEALPHQQRQSAIATTYHNLGIVAQALREYEEARRNYQQALQIKIEFGDRYEQARTYHNLGIVAQELREYEEARRNYQQALQIQIEFGDRYEQAGTYGQLGLLAKEEGDRTQARTYFEQALEWFVEFRDEYNAAIVQRNLEELG
ncbi:MAG: tetratricopeptide repeat protein [Oculatellaceae cyanobacterium Prado106]|nr:tetratricopeptide repeat protein [Oculatellaceae cyanobacterium Prado106]